MTNLFSNKVALVTGAASGIGEATAIAFAREGANVVVADTNTDHGERTVALIKSAGGKSFFKKCDVSQADQVKNLIEESVRVYGRLDYAFNNAGIEGSAAQTTDCTENNWDQTLSINLKGVWLCMKYEIPELLKNPDSAIVNCSSVAGLVGLEGMPAYVASKHGVVGLTKTAALEYASKNLRINAVCPGAIMTPMLQRFAGTQPGAMDTLIKTNEPIGRVGTPHEIAEAVLWLCSPKASFVTGQALAVDGGWVCR